MARFRVGRFVSVVALSCAVGSWLAPGTVAAEFAPFTDPETRNSPTVAVPAAVQVDGRMGAAAYSFAFPVPPGTGGLTPSITLQFSSLMRNGPYGYGWTIPYFSTIERSTRWGIPCYGEAGCRNPRYQNGDEFEVDGELLIFESQAGAETHYKKKRNDFSRIVYNSTSNAWTVQTPDGMKFSYGVTADARINNPHASNKTYRWALNYIEDPRGNQVRIYYTSFAPAAQIYPDVIRYSYSTTQSVPAQAKGRVVQFAWELRGEIADNEDVPTSYRPGFELKTTQRLKYVASGLVPNDSSSLISSSGVPQAGGTLLAKYELIYALKPVYDTTMQNENTEPHSKLIAIQRHGNDDSTFPTRTTFEYRDRIPGYGPTPSVVIDSRLGTAAMNYDGVMSKWVDANASGSLDAECLNEVPARPAGCIVPDVTEATSGRVMDFNGDSIADRILFTAKDNAAPTWEVALGSVDPQTGHPSFGTPQPWPWSAPTDKHAGKDRHHCSFTTTPDPIHPWLSCPGDLTDANADTGYWRISESYAVDQSTIHVADMADMNGDGLIDRVISRSNGNWLVYFNTGSGFGSAQSWTAPQIGPSGDNRRFLGYFEDVSGEVQVTTQLIDVNGDSRPDHLVRTGSTQASISYNNGGGFDAPLTRTIQDFGFISPSATSVLSTRNNFMDMNCDNLADRAFGTDSGATGMPNQAVRTYFNTGGDIANTQFAEQSGYPFPTAQGKWGVQLSLLGASITQPGFEQELPGQPGAGPFYPSRTVDETFFDFNGDCVLDYVTTEFTGGDPFDPFFDDYDNAIHYGLGDGRFLEQPFFWKNHGTYVGNGGLFEELIDSPDVKPTGELLMTTYIPVKRQISAQDYDDMAKSWALVWGHGATSMVATVSSLLDLNGDGFPDRVMVNDARGAVGNEHDPNYQYDRQWQVYLHPGPSTLLETVVNEYGGQTDITYQAASHYAEAQITSPTGVAYPADYNLPEPNAVEGMGQPMWVVSEQVVTDGRAGTPSTTTRFDYAKPRYDIDKRELLGMKMSDVVVEDQLLTRAIFRQKHDFPSIPILSEIAVDEGSGWELRSRTQSTPTVLPTTGDGPFYVQQMVASTAAAETIWSARVINEQKTVYNGTYGYAEEATEGGLDGLLSTPADNLKTVMCYTAPNTTDYLVSYPKETKVFYGGSGTATCTVDDGQRVSHTKLYYDDQVHGAAPTQGLATRQEQVNVNADGLPNTNTRQAYDGFGNPVEVWDPKAFAAANASNPYPAAFAPGSETTAVTYDATYLTLVETVTDANGNVVTFELDPRTGEVDKVLDPNGYLSCREFDAFERLRFVKETSSTTPVTIASVCDQVLEQHDYIIGVSGGDPDAENHYLKSTAYDAPGQVATESRGYFDGLGRSYKATETRLASELNKHYVTLQSWNALGHLECEGLPFSTLSPDTPKACLTDASVFLTHTYDALGRKTQTDHSALGQLDSIERFVGGFNRRGELVITFGAPDRGTLTFTDNRGQVALVGEYGAGWTYFAYDPLGRIEEINGSDVSTPNGPDTTHPNHMFITYDYLGRRTGLYKPNDVSDLNSGRVWEFAYDLNSNMTLLDSSIAGRDVQYHYDVLDRMTWKDLEPFNVDNGEDENLTYDACAYGLGQLCTQKNADVETKYNYFLGGEVNSKEVIVQNAFADQPNGTSYLFRYNYDLLSRVVDKKFPDDEFFDFTYDGAVLDEVSSREHGVWIDNLQYHDNGQLTSLHYANGDFTSHFDFDPNNYRLDRIWTQGPTSTVQDLNYAYDTSGNITQIDDALNLLDQTFTYDRLHRIRSAASTGTYNYGTLNYKVDPAGNLTQKGAATLEYGGSPEAGAHAVTLKTESGSFNYNYDWEGNLTSRGVAGGTQNLSWDSHNRLDYMQLETGDYLVFRYDTSGRRIHKTQCPTLTGCDAGWSETTQATVDRLYIDDDYEIDTMGDRYYKHVFVGGRRAVVGEYQGQGCGTAAP